MGEGGPERLAEVARGRLAKTSFFGIKNVSTSVQFDDIHDRILSVKVQTNTVQAWGDNHQEIA